jgi:hypothetical protein
MPELFLHAGISGLCVILGLDGTFRGVLIRSAVWHDSTSYQRSVYPCSFSSQIVIKEEKSAGESVYEAFFVSRDDVRTHCRIRVGRLTASLASASTANPSAGSPPPRSQGHAASRAQASPARGLGALEPRTVIPQGNSTKLAQDSLPCGRNSYLAQPVARLQCLR